MTWTDTYIVSNARSLLKKKKTANQSARTIVASSEKLKVE